MIQARPTDEGLIVLDYGSQYTLLIARRLREIGIYAEVIDGQAEHPPADFNFHGIILSGGPDSVTEVGSRTLPGWVTQSQKPVLGICYGMQLLTESSGGKVAAASKREYGQATLKIDPASVPDRIKPLVKDLPSSQTVWMSHGDTVQGIESSFSTFGLTNSDVIAAVAHKTLPYIGLQFHPEVHHSEHGDKILENFARHICEAPLNWQDADRLEATLKYVKEQVGDGHVLMAVSGGVDSTVAAVLLERALSPEQVTPVLVDNGLLRKDEAQRVLDRFKAMGVPNVQLLEAQDRFLGKLKGVSDPEQKRKIIGNTFIEEFEQFAKSLSQKFTHLGQGTLYPDVIESAGHGAGSKVIKSHHNVGGLPEHLALDLVEPFRFLFKDEVRQIGVDLGIPKELVFRHPFPGPGLGVRILGDISEDKVRILQDADEIYINKLREAGLYDEVWQAFAVLLPVKTVGVMGDNRTYQWTCAIRAVNATDGMTAGVSDLPLEFLVSVSDEIVRNVDGINRVVYDITTKPPATIEWE